MPKRATRALRAKRQFSCPANSLPAKAVLPLSKEGEFMLAWRQRMANLQRPKGLKGLEGLQGRLVALQTPLRHYVPPPPQRGEEFFPFRPFLPF